MKKQLIRAAATTVLGLSLTTGFAAADISGTGPSSYNTVKSHAHSSAKVTNTNHLTASNDNDQTAQSGAVSAWHNTTVGSAASGNTSNGNNFAATATVDNSAGTTAVASSASMPMAPAAGNISNTGPDSTNVIKSSTSNEVTVQNTNNLSVTNSNDQTAKSGNVNVSDNTTGGNATSGSASNSASSTVDFNVTN